MIRNCLILFAVICTQTVFAQDIVLNEVMALNQLTIMDEDGEYPDWIELYNVGQTLDLAGYSLSDDSLDLQKWTFDNRTVASGEYLLIFASDKDRQTANLHTNFKISAAGEKIYLSDTSGLIVDEVFVPASLADISYARESDGALPWTFQDPTPATANAGAGLSGYADPVVPLLTDHFYSSSITVELTAGDSDIFYTLDGSDPARDNSQAENWRASAGNGSPGAANTVLSIETRGDEQLPSTLVLRQNYPNPFNPLTLIEFILPEPERVVLTIFNVLGQKVAVLIEEQMTAGPHKVEFETRNLSTGVYFYEVQAGPHRQMKKMMLMK